MVAKIPFDIEYAGVEEGRKNAYLIEGNRKHGESAAIGKYCSSGDESTGKHEQLGYTTGEIHVIALQREKTLPFLR